jgi:hypothetical protein
MIAFTAMIAITAVIAGALWSGERCRPIGRFGFGVVRGMVMAAAIGRFSAVFARSRLDRIGAREVGRGMEVRAAMFMRVTVAVAMECIARHDAQEIERDGAVDR